MLVETPLEIYRATDHSFSVAVLQNGSPLNITGGQLNFRAKWYLTDSDANSAISVLNFTVTNASQGLATLNIPDTATTSFPKEKSVLHYVIWLVDASGKILVLAQGPLTILPTALD